MAIGTRITTLIKGIDIANKKYSTSIKKEEIDFIIADSVVKRIFIINPLIERMMYFEHFN